MLKEQEIHCDMFWRILLLKFSWPEEMAQGLEYAFVLGTCWSSTFLQLGRWDSKYDCVSPLWWLLSWHVVVGISDEEEVLQAWSMLEGSTLEVSSCTFCCRVDESYSRIVKKLCDGQETRTPPGRHTWSFWQWIALWNMHASWEHASWENWWTFVVVERFGHEEPWHSSSSETQSSTEVLNTKSCVNIENGRCTTCWNRSER